MVFQQPPHSKKTNGTTANSIKIERASSSSWFVDQPNGFWNFELFLSVFPVLSFKMDLDLHTLCSVAYISRSNINSSRVENLEQKKQTRFSFYRHVVHSAPVAKVIHTPVVHPVSVVRTAPIVHGNMSTAFIIVLLVLFFSHFIITYFMCANFSNQIFLFSIRSSHKLTHFVFI